MRADLTESCPFSAVEELGRATPDLGQKLIELTHGFMTLAITQPMKSLARRYVDERVVPPRYFDDALHIAAAVVGDADILVSWDFKHLVRRSTRLLVNYVNAVRGFRAIEILAPPEV